MEAKRGVSSLELLVNEFKEEEDAKERRREHKRLKKKQKRAIKSRPSLPTSCRVSAVHGQLDVGMPNDSELLEENSVLFVNGICSRSEDCVCCHGLGDDDSSSESCGPRENGPSQDIAHLVGGEARERDDVIGGCLTDQYCDSTACVHGIDVVQLSGKCASECRCLDDDLIQEVRMSHVCYICIHLGHSFIDHRKTKTSILFHRKTSMHLLPTSKNLKRYVKNSEQS